MRYLTFAPEDKQKFPICILTPQIMKNDILAAYITPFGIDPNDVLVLDLHQAEGKKKTPMSEMKAYIEEELLTVLKDCEVQYLVITDSDYFKAFTKETKAEVHLGYIKPSALSAHEVIYVPNYRQIFYDPDKVRAKINQGMTALTQHMTGNYQAPGIDIIHFAEYPHDPARIEWWLEQFILADKPLSSDIEAFSLKHHTAGIGTITFCWNQHEGISFPVDLGPDPKRVRAALKSFFIRFKNKLLWHSISYDVYVLIYQLFMDDILDTEGMLDGLEVMLMEWECTKLITYLATNSCAGNDLGLKSNAQEFSGNYAVDEIDDITKIPLADLLQYNLIDGLSTWYVFNKNYPIMLADQQLDIYTNLFKTATWDIIQMQLTGMPVNMKRVQEVKAILHADEDAALQKIHGSPLVKQFVYTLNEDWVAMKNRTLKVKRVTLADAKEEFNPNSAPQLQSLLYGMLQLPVLAKTDSGLPATDKDAIKALVHHTSIPMVKELLAALLDYKDVNKITTSFIPAMENAAEGPDGWHYLFGNFNLGGTLSGRLSSSKPNLQNLPANSRYAKLIKSCFQAPPGWLFAGLDFDSLEDRISALTTKDPNKLKVYTDGYDGHSLRAFSYFREQMPDILQSEGRRVFKVTQGDQTHYLFEGDLVSLLDGTTASIETIA